MNNFASSKSARLAGAAACAAVVFLAGCASGGGLELAAPASGGGAAAEQPAPAPAPEPDQFGKAPAADPCTGDLPAMAPGSPELELHIAECHGGDGSTHHDNRPESPMGDYVA